MRSSVLASSCCRARKCASALSVGYASATANSRFTPICRADSSTAWLAGRAVVRHRPVAKLDDELQHVTLVLSVAADGFDEIRNQLVPPLHFDFDIGPALANLLADADEAVEIRDQPQERQEHDEREDDENSVSFHTAVLATLECRDEMLWPEVEELVGPVEPLPELGGATRCCCRR